MLQVIDEIDDAVSTSRQWWMGVHAEIGLSLLSGIGIGAIVAAIWMGQEALLICAGVLMLGCAGMLKINAFHLEAGR